MVNPAFRNATGEKQCARERSQLSELVKLHFPLLLFRKLRWRSLQ